MKQGLLLINLGTPDSPSTSDVRSYLKEFLWDSRVLDLSPVARSLLLYGVILPFRPAKSAEAYSKIWTADGSPLLINTRDLASAVARILPAISTRFAMRYGSPSIEETLWEFQRDGVRRIIILPLYPQYSASATASSIAHVYKCAAKMNDPPELDVLPSFFEHAGFISEVAKTLEGIRSDHLLFSFHGLPERQIKRSVNADGCFEKSDCCDKPGDRLQLCYRAQCFATARLVAKKAGIRKFSIAFQSRLGRTPWIKPYTDEVLKELPGKGIKRLAVICPSFVADCLETLEEIDIRARADFLAAGGESFEYVPCLNAKPSWARVIAEMARKKL